MAAGDQQRIGHQEAPRAAAQAVESDSGDTVSPRDRLDHALLEHRDACCHGTSGRLRLGAHVHDAGDVHAGGLEGERRLVGFVVVHEERRALPDADAVTAQVGERGTGEHDPGAVIVREGDQALDCPAGEHYALHADHPQALAQAAAACAFRGIECLERAEHAVAIGTEHGGAHQAA